MVVIIQEDMPNPYDNITKKSYVKLQLYRFDTQIFWNFLTLQMS